jgi:hypothetical protein
MSNSTPTKANIQQLLNNKHMKQHHLKDLAFDNHPQCETHHHRPPKSSFYSNSIKSITKIYTSIVQLPLAKKRRVDLLIKQIWVKSQGKCACQVERCAWQEGESACERRVTPLHLRGDSPTKREMCGSETRHM